ncbi:outer membrane protein [Methylocystis parvus]|uniref:outer membrane protein n=1 Tax=Methylocystis parvus TaxID=134 RepID=UPI003C73C1F7
MKISRALLCAPLLLAASAAFGADLPSRSSAPPIEYAPPPPALTWGGFYAGVHGGVGFASFTNDAGRLIGDPTGGLIGLTGGFNYMAAPQLLIGAEADFAFAGISATTSPFWNAAAKGEVDDLFTIRGRAGYAVMDRALLYVTGGFAASKNTLQYAQGPFYGFQASFQPGWALGAGVEYMITPRVSAKGEYMFTSTGSGRYFDFSPYALDSGVNMSAVKAGMNFHF